MHYNIVNIVENNWMSIGINTVTSRPFSVLSQAYRVSLWRQGNTYSLASKCGAPLVIALSKRRAIRISNNVFENHCMCTIIVTVAIVTCRPANDDLKTRLPAPGTGRASQLSLRGVRTAHELSSSAPELSSEREPNEAYLFT